MKERVIEKYLDTRVRELGGLTYKFVPVVAGSPDRIVLLPPGQVLLVELKAPGGKIRPVQRVWHARAAKVGVQVAVLSSKQEVDQWLALAQ